MIKNKLKEDEDAIDYAKLRDNMQSCLDDLDRGNFGMLAAQLDLVIRRFEAATGLAPPDGLHASH